MNITRQDNNALIETENVAFTFSVMENPRDLEEKQIKEQDFNWSNYQMWWFDNFVIHPFGIDNNLPNKIRDVVQKNYIAPGLLKKKKKMLWGGGPKLYIENVEDKQIFKDWKDRREPEAKEIYKWLTTDWDYEEYLRDCITSYNYMEGVFSKSIRSRGSIIGNNWIKRLEHVSHDHCRAATKIKEDDDKNLYKYRKATHFIETDYSLNHISDMLDYKLYNKFEISDPFKHRHAISYAKTSTFLQDIYTLPDIYGALEWLKRSTAIPLMFNALSKNSINLKYHIESPQEYWDNVEKRLKEKHKEKYSDQLLKEFERNFMRKIASTLSGEHNSGKFIHTKRTLYVDGTDLLEMGWTIKEINQNVKDFIEAHVSISKTADHAVATAINIHSALGGLSEAGKANSGSEQLYAYTIYLLSGIDLDESIICKHLNECIRANFPGTDLRVGFFHGQIQREQDKSEKDRLKSDIM